MPILESAGTRQAARILGGIAIELEQLQRALAAADPAAILVPARILRRVVRVDRGLRWLVGEHPTSYVIAGAALQAIVDGTELGRAPAAPWPSTALLIAQPEPEELAQKDSGVVLTEVWRRLFRARVERELDAAFESAKIEPAGLAARIDAIGPTEFEEARAVLRQDGLLLAPASDLAAYTEFAAVFLELTCFDPAARAIVFPAIESAVSVESVLARDLDGQALLAGTRPTGAPEPSPPPSEDGADGEIETPVETIEDDEPLEEPAAARVREERLAALARTAAARGNTVRAAILWTRLANRAGPEADQAARAAARAALRQLAVRLRKALFVQKGEASLWVEALVPLLKLAASGFWSPERRLLYDLQSVCIDHEREVFRLEPFRWLLSLGRRPLKHPLPHLREVVMSKHLRSAAKWLHRVRLPRDARVRLEGLLGPAVNRAEEALRRRFRPWVDSTLESEWARPGNLPERVAYRKLVEEMIDPIVARGFTTLGDLRDAASRGNLKLSDLSGPGEFFRGDRLLQADRALGEVVDGVHRSGEIYLRWLQRFSALAFGTRLGRVLTRYLALPYGGSFVLLKGFEEINDVLLARVTGAHLHLVNPASVLLFGTIALGLINHAQFRRALLTTARVLGQVLRVAFWEIPARLINEPLVRRLLDSAVAISAWRYLLKPGLVTAGLWALARVAGFGPTAANALGLATFLAASFVFNTRAGAMLEELAVDRVSHAWHSLIFEVVPGLFRIIMSAFAGALEWVEKLIYAGDEWLRFREGQSRVLLAAKAVLAPVWGVAAYAVRVYLTLLVEPQINPIKHFPVVTVAAKLMLPFALTLTGVVAAPLTPFLGVVIAKSIAAATVFFFPGFFGFLVWELRANWRLYEANRPESLGALAVGSHGETVVRFLRPGFHSGTVPKRFARWRRTRQAGREQAALKQREALHHVQEAVRTLVKREFAALLRESRSLHDWSIEPGSIRLATNRIRIELLAAARDRPSLWIDLEERSGALAARIARPGWLESVNGAQLLTLADAIAGLYKLSGVKVVRALGERVWASLGESDTAGDAKICPGSVDFTAVVIPWPAWVAAWEGDAPRVPDAGGPAWRAGVLPGLVPPPDRREPG
ncbi:MAG: hypothetical protein ACLQVF_09120 [Isosphaeraceae bacterium]